MEFTARNLYLEDTPMTFGGKAYARAGHQQHRIWNVRAVIRSCLNYNMFEMSDLLEDQLL